MTLCKTGLLLACLDVVMPNVGSVSRGWECMLCVVLWWESRWRVSPGRFCMKSSRGVCCRTRTTRACAVTLPIFLRFVVHGLTTGEQYIFRVKAVNAVGMSENSQESEVIKVQAALSA